MEHCQKHERDQAETLLDILLRDGGMVSVYDGEAWALKQSTDKAAILHAMGSTDADTLRWRNPDGVNLGSFVLIYGNGPGELVADHTDNDACNAAWAEWWGVWDIVHGRP